MKNFFSLWWMGAIILLLTTASAHADALALVTDSSAQSADDSVPWSQLGSNGTSLPASFDANSIGGTTVSVALTGPDSLLSVVCPSSACNWMGRGLPAGDSLLWTSDGHNGGNGPITLSFDDAMAGAGAFIQADSPAQFTAQIEAFDGATSLGSFAATSDSTGQPLYIGVLDNSDANISAIVLTVSDTAGQSTADFAIDTLYLTSSVAMPPTLVPTATATPKPRRRRRRKHQ